MKSMTGFGSFAIQKDGISLQFEIKTINHRFNEIKIKLPLELASLEYLALQWIKKYIRRGNVSLTVSMEKNMVIASEVKFNAQLAEAYLSKLKEFKEEKALCGEISINTLIALPGLFEIREPTSPDPYLTEIFEEGLEKTLQELDKMRFFEGEKIKKDMGELLNAVEMNVEQIKGIHSEDVINHKQRLEKRVKELFDKDNFDPERLEQEAILYAERSDINEEIVRFESHISQIKEAFISSEPVGKKLEFLLQEMAREANTISYKSLDPRISKLIVEIKTNLEKMREHAQNIE